MGKLRLICSLVQLWLANKSKFVPIGQLTQATIWIEGIETYVDFELIEIIDDTNPYPTLLWIDWEIDNQTIINFKKRILTFRDLELKVVAPIDPLEGQRYIELVNSEGQGYFMD